MELIYVNCKLLIIHALNDQLPNLKTDLCLKCLTLKVLSILLKRAKYC